MSDVRRRIATLNSLLSLPTPWPAGRNSNRWFLVIAVLGFVFLAVPRAVGWRGNYLHSEDGQVFLTEFLDSGWLAVFDTYAGYLHVVPRTLTAACATITGPDGYAACVAISSNTVRVSLMLLAFPVFTAYARSWRWGLTAAALTFIFLPAGQQEVLANFTNLRWFLLAGAFLAIIGIFQHWWLIGFASAIALAAGLSDPLPMLLAPFAVWRVFAAPRWSKLPSLALLIASVFHLVSLDAGARGERGGFIDLVSNPVETIGQLAVRGWLTTQWGVTISQDLASNIGFPLALSTLLVTGVLLWLGWKGRFPRDPAIPFAVLLTGMGFTFLLITLSFPASYISLADFWSPSQPARYSALTGLFLTPVLVLAMSRAWRTSWHRSVSRGWVFLTSLVLAVAIVGDSGGDARSTDGPTWTQSLQLARSVCDSGATTATVPNAAAFEGWRTTLTCEWIYVR
jgi:hypothetical protein